MRRQQFLPEFILLNHELEINIDIFATLCVLFLSDLLDPLSLLHLDPPLLPILLNLLDLLQMTSLLLTLHLNYIQFW